VSSLKTFLVVTVLSAVAYGVYVALTVPPPSDPPPGATAGSFDAPPAIDLPASPFDAGSVTATVPAMPDRGEAPPFLPSGGSSSGAEAPPFNPAGTETSEAPPYNPSGNAAAESSSSMRDVAAGAGGFDAASVSVPYGDSAVAPPYGNPASSSGNSAAPFDFLAATQDASQMLEAGRLSDALLNLSQLWYGNDELAPDEEAQLLDVLDQVAGSVIYSQQHLLEPAYEVQPGDHLERIASSYNVPWQLLAKINGIADPQQLPVGTKLKVLRGPFDAVVDLDRHELVLMLNGRYAGRFAIGIGHDQTTPEGEFLVSEKVANPTYYGADAMIGADDPANPLGERWIGLVQASDPGSKTGLGIHGTNDPTSIGRDDSKGCIRLSPTDVEDVFDILSAQSEQARASRVILRR